MTTEEKLERRRIRKKIRIIKRIWVGIMIFLAFWIGFAVGNKKASKANQKNLRDSVSQSIDGGLLSGAQDEGLDAAEASITSAESVPKPKEYTYEEALECLGTKAESDSRFTNILNQTDMYPQDLLKSLANNSELIDFVSSYTGSVDKAEGVELTDTEKEAACPFFLQWDSRWGSQSYGDGIIAYSGCGPTALSMVIVALTDNDEATPNEVAEFAMDNGYYMEGTGTSWALMSDGASNYGLMSECIYNDEQSMRNVLSEGGLLICSMAPGDFTAGGHFIVIRGCDDNGFYVNDPFCIYRSSRQWSFSELTGQLKNIWALSARN